jgi:hypothetical protein
MAVLSCTQHPHIIQVYACLTNMVEGEGAPGGRTAAIGRPGALATREARLRLYAAGCLPAGPLRAHTLNPCPATPRPPLSPPSLRRARDGRAGRRAAAALPQGAAAGGRPRGVVQPHRHGGGRAGGGSKGVGGLGTKRGLAEPPSTACQSEALATPCTPRCRPPPRRARPKRPLRPFERLNPPPQYMDVGTLRDALKRGVFHRRVGHNAMAVDLTGCIKVGGERQGVQSLGVAMRSCGLRPLERAGPVVAGGTDAACQADRSAPPKPHPHCLPPGAAGGGAGGGAPAHPQAAALRHQGAGWEGQLRDWGLRRGVRGRQGLGLLDPALPVLRAAPPCLIPPTPPPLPPPRPFPRTPQSENVLLKTDATRALGFLCK